MRTTSLSPISLLRRALRRPPRAPYRLFDDSISPGLVFLGERRATTGTVIDAVRVRAIFVGLFQHRLNVEGDVRIFARQRHADARQPLLQRARIQIELIALPLGSIHAY